MHRYKFKIESKEFDKILYFKYDKKKKLYGYGDDITKIEIKIPYTEIKKISFHFLESDNFYQFDNHPRFR